MTLSCGTGRRIARRPWSTEGRAPRHPRPRLRLESSSPSRCWLRHRRWKRFCSGPKVSPRNSARGRSSSRCRRSAPRRSAPSLPGCPQAPSRAKRSNLESGRYPPSFKLRLAAKDLRLVTEAAEAGGLDVKAARAARAWLEEAIGQGLGDLDYSAVVATIAGEARRRAGNEEPPTSH